MKLSVIIPAYNVQDYIIKCLDSLHFQQYNDVEYLIIDDGSTDNTAKCISSYLNGIEDSRFKYFYKDNGGLSDARNYGLSKATGDYIWYLDSDDYVPKDNAVIEKLMYKTEIVNPEMLIFNFKYDESWPLRYANHTSDLIGCDHVQKGTAILQRSSFNFSVWHMFFQRNFILQNKITFKKGSTSEDLLYTAECLLKAQRVLIYPLIAYVYVYRSNSLTKSTDCRKVTKRINDVIDSTLTIDLKMKSINLNSSILVSGFIAQSMMAFATGYVSIPRSEMKKFFKGKKLNFKEYLKKIILLYMPQKIRKLLCKKILNV